jgi:hypothetical protein
MHPQFKKFLLESNLFALLNEGLTKKLSLKIMALKIKEPKKREEALKLATELQRKAIARAKSSYTNFEIDNDLDKIN